MLHSIRAWWNRWGFSRKQRRPGRTRLSGERAAPLRAASARTFDPACLAHLRLRGGAAAGHSVFACVIRERLEGPCTSKRTELARPRRRPAPPRPPACAHLAVGLVADDPHARARLPQHANKQRLAAATGAAAVPRVQPKPQHAACQGHRRGRDLVRATGALGREGGPTHAQCVGPNTAARESEPGAQSLRWEIAVMLWQQ